MDRLLAKDPDDRFPDALDAAKALDAYLSRVGAMVGARLVAVQDEDPIVAATFQAVVPMQREVVLPALLVDHGAQVAGGLDGPVARARVEDDDLVDRLEQLERCERGLEALFFVAYDHRR